jgi:hypothetical protein
MGPVPVPAWSRVVQAFLDGEARGCSTVDVFVWMPTGGAGRCAALSSMCAHNVGMNGSIQLVGLLGSVEVVSPWDGS